MAHIYSAEASNTPVYLGPGSNDDDAARFFAPLPPGGHFQDRFPQKSGSVLYSAATQVYAIRTSVRLKHAHTHTQKHLNDNTTKKQNKIAQASAWNSSAPTMFPRALALALVRRSVSSGHIR